MGERLGEAESGSGRNQRPVAPPGQTTREDARIVGEIGDREGPDAKIFQRRRRSERRDDPMLVLGDEAERRDMGAARNDRR